jgi:type IV secretion system protein VirB10
LEVNMRPCENEKMRKYSRLPIICVLIFIFALPQVYSAAADVIIPEGTRIYLQLNNQISTRNAEGDVFKAIVTEPVTVGDRIVIPKGSQVAGSIARILRPGRVKGKAAMTLLFQTVEIPGRGPMPIVASLVGVGREGIGGLSTEGTIEGEGSTGKDFGRVITPGLIGAGIGTIAGGRRGAGIGAGIGAAVGLATVFSSKGKEIELPRGSSLNIALDKPLPVPPEGESAAAKTH